MGFLNSVLLWGGLAAAGVAVPIVIHLLHRKHKRQTEWAAMELLRKALVVRSGQIKLEDLIVLLLRCLVLALLALALMRPTVHRETTLIGVGQQRIGAVVAIDSSYSMAHGRFGKRHDRAIERAGAILSTLRDGDPVTVVQMGARPRILIRSTGYDAERFARVLDTEARVLPESLNLERNMAELERLAAELKTPIRECYLVTDGQAIDWSAPSDEAIATLNRLGKTAKVYLVPVAVDGEDNVAVRSLTYESGALRRNEMARFSAQVVNHGRQPRDAGALVFSVNGEAVGKRAVGVIEPGQARAVPFFWSFSTAGDVRIEAALTPDDLLTDNRRYAVVSVRPSIRVLSVDGEPSPREPAMGETFYLDRALRGKARGEDASLLVVRAERQDLEDENLADYDVVVLANVADLSEATVGKLDRFVRRGGGLMVFAGDRIDAERYNARMRTAEGTLLPAVLEKIVEAPDPDQGWLLGVSRVGHPISDMIGRLPAELLDGARFARVFKAAPTEGAVILVTLAGEELPLLIEKQIGKGTVLLFLCPADAEWGTFPIHPLYGMLLHQAVTHMTSRPGRNIAVIGQTVTFPTEGKRLGDTVNVIGPGGKTSEAKVVAVDGYPSCIFEPEAEGFYGIEKDGEILSSVAVNTDGAESDVKVLSESDLTRQADTLSMSLMPIGANAADFVESGRKGFELARLLALAALAAMLLQSWLARRFTHRMTDGITDVAADVTRGRVAGARKAQVE